MYQTREHFLWTSYLYGPLWHGRHEQLSVRRARRQVVQRRRQVVLLPHVHGGGLEVVDEGEYDPVPAILWQFYSGVARFIIDNLA